MTRRTNARGAAMTVAALIIASSCGGGDDATGADAGETSAEAGDASTTDAPDPGAAGGDDVEGATEPVDVCELLSPQDGAEVAKASRLGGDGNATSTFSIDATPEPSTVAMVLGGCRFEVYYAAQGSTDRVFSGTIVIQAMPADDFGLIYGGGTAVPGLGDEAYSDLGTTVMRVGGVMLSVGENSLSEGFVQAMFAKMAPNLV